jgi:hypothetical protein
MTALYTPGSTLIVNLCVGALAPSLSVNVALQMLLPKAPGIGVNVSTPVELSSGCALNSAAFVQTRENSTVWLASPGPAVMLVAQALLETPVLSGTETLLGPAVNDGGSSTATETARHRGCSICHSTGEPE